jgi:hypothetical protein
MKTNHPLCQKCHRIETANAGGVCSMCLLGRRVKIPKGGLAPETGGKSLNSQAAKMANDHEQAVAAIRAATANDFVRIATELLTAELRRSPQFRDWFLLAEIHAAAGAGGVLEKYEIAYNLASMRAREL